jgi:hypothetical protein
MRYQGELSRYIDEALTSSDLGNIQLILVALGRASPTIMAVVSRHADARLRAAAKLRRCSVTVPANSALNRWLGGKHA